MNVINKIKNMGYIPKENRTFDDFIKNVESYHKYEVLAQDKLSSFFKTSLKSFNDTKDYDILLENNLKFEVKFIGTFDKYETVYIECFRNNKSSGILTTQSDYYIITNGKIYYLIKTGELLKICEICEIKKLKYSFCYMIPKALFIASSLVI